ncbi:hypothetical protein Desde_1104 [Desulfitobacterium dehalogenans ATCC 51507]|uniref:Ketopantoate hydroxymethyltransferase n=1 Tax=Desulfitobacterium dehalogenans (strain ATCC 51507 / DSM 9161 / JW/IU-DC1) TaxID=756499 RepID=I4A6F2_DESDJ|nr:hypothetical protein [Desulfitobacterium dehalogenans]AFL99536.1 hypothetical protein Desde_1104 [Desulfitobacterium dehalogenans ATCC 51507]
MIPITFLEDVADYVDGRITKVVLNGYYEITDFDVKQVREGIINMEYKVHNGAVPLITLIELRDSSNNVISSNNVYVPITTDTIITQTIRVKEG